MNTQIQDTATPTGEPVDKVLERPQPVSFRQAFWFWLKLGFISFGGPAGQIAIMHTELVERRRWISERRFLHALNYCMLLRAGGAAARNLYRMAAASDLGRNRRGRPVCPAVAVYPHRTVLGLCRLGRCARHCRPVPWHQAGRDRHRPIRGPSHRIARAENPVLWSIAAAAFVAIFAMALPFPLIVAIAALIGFVGGRRWPVFPGGVASWIEFARLRSGIDRRRHPSPAHARFRWSRLIWIVAAGVALWATPMAILAAIYGWQGAYTQMGWFFTKAAYLTFGGAYAVLPYIYQGAVDHYGWLTPIQMIDGLALGETTPAP